ncbi:hypothetical protein OC834_002121 [Tilletia horrida]|nr:hypothetical protein OC834_002121 [Tilletia horrida]
MSALAPLPASSAPSRSAVSRFFNSAELVELLMTYLVLDRVDLLVLASVSKPIRHFALRAWARHLDIITHFAEHQLKFLKSNEEVAGHVRYLRIRDPLTENRRGLARDSAKPPFARVPLTQAWDEISQLLCMIDFGLPEGTQPPYIDITIAITEAWQLDKVFTLFPEMLERVVAVRVLVDDSLKIKKPDTAWLANWEALGMFLSKVRFAARENGASGLLTFHYGEYGAEPSKANWYRPEVPSTFWTDFQGVVDSPLSDLSLSLGSRDKLSSICPYIYYPSLRNLYLSVQTQDPNEDDLDIFLERHSELRSLTLKGCRGLYLHQRFPQLQRYFFGCGDDRMYKSRADFGRRHPVPAQKEYLSYHNEQVVAADTATTAEGQTKAYFPSGWDETSSRKGPITHLVNSLELALLPTRSWLAHDALAAHSITCLELGLECSDPDLAQSRASLGRAVHADWLPNLAELSLSFNRYALSDDPNNARGLSAREVGESLARWIVGALQGARALRVLTLVSQDGAREMLEELRVGERLLDGFAEFPPALEYVAWWQDKLGVGRSFRCVSIENDAAGGEEGQPINGRRGFLQVIPSMWRTQISRQGVWSFNMDPQERAIVLDHASGPGAVLQLS